MIKALIIDDEMYSCQVLQTLLQRNCEDVAVAELCTDPRQAAALVKMHRPQLVFLDIEMPHINGFELLASLLPLSFEVIFTTSYDQYAIKAIRFSALDYLMKPIDPEELKTAVETFRQRSSHTFPQQLDILLSRFIQPSAQPARIALPTMEGLQIIPVADILYCGSSSNYTILTLKEKQKLTISRTLKEVEEMLEDHNFLRVHNSFLVNLAEVKKYIRGEGGSLMMSDGASVDVSRSRKETLLQKLTAGR